MVERTKNPTPDRLNECMRDLPWEEYTCPRQLGRGWEPKQWPVPLGWGSVSGVADLGADARVTGDSVLHRHRVHAQMAL